MSTPNVDTFTRPSRVSANVFSGPGDDPFVLDERVEERDAEFAGEVIVAKPRVAQRRLFRAGTRAQRLGARGDAHQRFEQARDVGIRETVIAMAPLRFDGDEAGVVELAQMRARGLLGDAGFEREFSRGERHAVQQGRQHVGACGIADHGGDALRCLGLLSWFDASRTI